MRSRQIPELESLLKDLDGVLERMNGDIKTMGTIIRSMADLCGDEIELISVMQREDKRLRALGELVEGFSFVRQMRRRLPRVASRLRREEQEKKQEDTHIQRQAEQVRQSLEDTLRRFLRGNS